MRAYEGPVVCGGGTALTAYFALAPGGADALLPPGVRTAGGRRALAVVHAAEHGRHREVTLGVVVRDPDPGRVWTEVRRRAHRRVTAVHPLVSVFSTDAARAAAEEVWGRTAITAPVEMSWTGGTVRVAAGRVLALTGVPGPGLPAAARDLITCTDLDGVRLRTRIETRGRRRVHPVPRLRLALRTGPLFPSLHPLGVDGARPLLCLSTPAHRCRQAAGTPVP